MKTFNKKGDKGTTSLLYGIRVAKSDPRCEAYGTIDEAVSALGLARTLCCPEVNQVLIERQRELFSVGAELATPQEHYVKIVDRGIVITTAMVQKLEDSINEFEAKVKMPQSFIIPGASTGSATLHLARTIIRRAERRIVGLAEAGLVQNEEILKYMNRLADLVFTLARYEEEKEKREA